MGGKMPKEYHRDYYRKHLAATPLHNGEHRVTPKATAKPTVQQMAWAAGFMEGEGHFRVGSIASATQCNQGPLLMLQRWFGGSINAGGVYARNRQVPYRWTISGARARGFMLTIYVWLSPRRQAQCLAALKAVGSSGAGEGET